MEEPVEVTIAPVANRIRYIRRFGFIVASMCLAAILTEGVVRVLRLGPRVFVPNHIEPDGRIPWMMLHEHLPCYRPSTIFSEVYDPAGDKRGYFGPTGRVIYSINHEGSRVSPVGVARSSGTLRVVCVGDSFTFGVGVNIEDTYPTLLEKRLAPCYPDKKVEVINAGVQAYGTVEEGSLYLLRCQQFKPDVLTMGFVLNDAMTYEETAGWWNSGDGENALSGMGRASQVWGIVERHFKVAKIQEKFFVDIRRTFGSKQWDLCKDVLVKLSKLTRREGCRFVVVIFPVFYGLEGEYPFADIHALVAEACRNSGCECLDLLDSFRGRRSEDLWVHPTDQHPNEIAHRIAAERIAAYLCEKKPK